MAVHHPATILPGKSELLQARVPGRPWAAGTDTSTLVRLGSYRFDDPGGEVGMETHLLGTADDQVLQVPLTYRGAPADLGPAALVTTMTHSTLGDRWVYDGLYDPVYLTALATTIATGGREADLFEATADGLVLEPSTTHVRGSGTAPAGGSPDWSAAALSVLGATRRARAADGVLTVEHAPKDGTRAAGPASALTGTWPGQALPLVLATLTPHVADG